MFAAFATLCLTIARIAMPDETYRPQFHFTSASDWINDPNGLVFYKGEYHMFFQRTPGSLQSGDKAWGHAISKDLIHWNQLADAISPDERGNVWSGSAVVDQANTAGFNTGKEKAIVAIYTAAGGTSPKSHGQPFTQCIAYSLDRGRTFTKYAGNPVIPHIVGEDRDPKVVWFEATKSWILAMYLDGDNYGLFSSKDLKSWRQIQTIEMPGCGECPDFFPMPIEGERGAERWVFTAANGRYFVGTFDGLRYTPDGPSQQADFGANYYAVQTFSDIPPRDGRRVQVAWMAGGQYPGMPFNQQMSFPCTLELRRTSAGIRMFRNPVREIEKLHSDAFSARDSDIGSADSVLQTLHGQLWDIEAKLSPGNGRSVTITSNGEPIVVDFGAKTVSCLGRSASYDADQPSVTLRILVDRTSIEVFVDGGLASLNSCYLPKNGQAGVRLTQDGAGSRIELLQVWKLSSALRAASHDSARQ